MNAYGMRADQAGEISDWLFQVVKRGQSTSPSAPSIGNVGYDRHCRRQPR